MCSDDSHSKPEKCNFVFHYLDSPTILQVAEVHPNLAWLHNTQWGRYMPLQRSKCLNIHFLPSQKMCQLSWNFQHSLSAKLENVSTVSLEYMIVTTRAMHVVLPMHKTIPQIGKKIASSIWCSIGKSGAGVNVTHLTKLTCSNLGGISLN